MSTFRSNPTLLFFIFFLLLTPSQSLPFSFYFRYRDLFSVSHSIFTGVANLREARGDFTGADRARAIADTIDRVNGFGFWKLVWSAWTWTWTWKDFPFTDLYGAVSDMNELLSALDELTRLKSPSETSVWLSRHYQNLLKVFKSLSRKLIEAFGQSEVKEIVEALQKEVVEGGLIKDCLELGTNDLKGLIQVAKDLLLQFFPVRDKDPDL